MIYLKGRLLFGGVPRPGKETVRRKCSLPLKTAEIMTVNPHREK